MTPLAGWLRAGWVVGGAMLLIAGDAAEAAPPPFENRPVSLTARDQDVAAFVREFYSAAGLTVNVGGSVSGRINGRFEGPPQQVWANVSRAFNLVAYYDGAVVTVYGAGEVQTRAIPVPSGRAGELVASADRAQLTDTNNRLRSTAADSVLASGVPRFIEQVQQLATNLSTQRPRVAEISPDVRRQIEATGGIEPYELRVFYLRYARADDTVLTAAGREVRVPGVGTTLSQVMGDGAPVFGSVSASYAGRRLRQSQPRLGGRGLDSVAPDGTQTTPYDLPPDDGDYIGLPPGQAQAAPRYSQSGPRISIDPSINAVIVRDRPENMAAYEGLVRAIDIAPQIIELEATIIDLNIEKLRELGINWRIRSEGFSALFGGDILRRDGNPAADIANSGSANRGLSLSTIIGSNQEFIARISALEERGAVRIVSRPQLVTLSNVEAVFDRTRTFYVRVAGDRQVDLFNVSAGTVLRVNPHVLAEDNNIRIRLSVGVEDGAILASEVQDIPIVERASVSTQAMINEGESLLLGGMVVDSRVDAESQIPILGDIPIIGALFRERSRSARRIERLFLITPRIIRLDQPRVADSATSAAAAAAGALQ